MSCSALHSGANAEVWKLWRRLFFSLPHIHHHHRANVHVPDRSNQTPCYLLCLIQYTTLSAYEWSREGRLRLLQALQRWWYTLALYWSPEYKRMVMAIFLLDHPLHLHAVLWHLKRPMTFVLWLREQDSSSLSWNRGSRSKSLSNCTTSSWRAGNIDQRSTGSCSVCAISVPDNLDSSWNKWNNGRLSKRFEPLLIWSTTGEDWELYISLHSKNSTRNRQVSRDKWVIEVLLVLMYPVTYFACMITLYEPTAYS